MSSRKNANLCTALGTRQVAQTLGGLICAHGPAAVHGFVDAVASDPGALDELRRHLDRRSRTKR